MLLTPDQLMIRDAVRDFAQQELWPHAAEWDKTHHFPKDVHQGLAALGAYGICVPESLGGAGLDYLSLAVVRSAEASEPTCGSVKQKAPSMWPWANSVSHFFFCASLP